MDTFIDKLAQKRNAQEMIRANAAAEAAKMEQMQKQMEEYDELMQEIRRVNIKTAGNVEDVRDLLAQCMDRLESIKIENESRKSAVEQMAAVEKLVDGQTAAIKKLLDEQTGVVKGFVEGQNDAVRHLLGERLTKTEDVVHKENVKVYRNVQAAFTEEMEKQNQQGEQSRADQGTGVSKKLAVAILIGVLVDIAVNLVPLITQLTNTKLF